MNSGVEKAYILEEKASPLPLETIGNALVIAPHPDDESLGCGGTIALLRQQGYSVHVVFVSDGTMSHPNSPSNPAERLRKLRETEAQEALDVLNVAADKIYFMGLKDRQVPVPDKTGFPEAAEIIRNLLVAIRPATVFVPWQRDPHPDHRASWHLLNTALSEMPDRPRVLEYLIWLWELGSDEDMPDAEEVKVWCVPIGSVMAQRNQAIAAHRSQVTRLIDDDPTAFYLSPELLLHFEKPRELFLEKITHP